MHKQYTPSDAAPALAKQQKAQDKRTSPATRIHPRQAESAYILSAMPATRNAHPPPSHHRDPSQLPSPATRNHRPTGPHRHSEPLVCHSSRSLAVMHGCSGRSVANTVQPPRPRLKSKNPSLHMREKAKRRKERCHLLISPERKN